MPVICCVIADAWLKAIARHAIMSVRARYELFEVDPLLHSCANFIVHWIQIWDSGCWSRLMK